jgi:hypothetical protein
MKTKTQLTRLRCSAGNNRQDPGGADRCERCIGPILESLQHHALRSLTERLALRLASLLASRTASVFFVEGVRYTR